MQHLVKCKAKICLKHCINLLVFGLFSYMFGFLAATCFPPVEGSHGKKKRKKCSGKKKRVFLGSVCESHGSGVPK